MDRFGRRDALRVLGLGAVSLGSGGAVHVSHAEAEVAADSPPAEPVSPAPVDASTAPPWRLVAPLSIGSMLGNVRLTELSAVTTTGTVDVQFETADSTRFRARLCRRDPDPTAPSPIARTLHYDLFLANHGRGEKPTDEEQGVTIMALAAVVRQNEQACGPVAVGTLRQRWRRLAQGTV
jgi:hypothetical protein